MKASFEKRRKIDDRPILDKDADFPVIAAWLNQVNLLEENLRDSSITAVLQTHPPALVAKLLEYFAIVEIFRLIAPNNFIIIRSLSELIRLEFDSESVAEKLFMITRGILSGHRAIGVEQLQAFWGVLETSIKRPVLESLDIAVFSEFFKRINAAFTKELIPHLQHEQWLGLLAQDDFAFCRQLVSTPDIDLTLNKLKILLEERFTPPYQAIVHACFKHAIIQDCENFFASFLRQQVKVDFDLVETDLGEIVVLFNRFDLLITAYHATNFAFLSLLLQHLPDVYRRKVLVLVATWLSLELNALETENDNLRGGILADLSRILHDRQLIAEYGTIQDPDLIAAAKARIIKARSSQLSDYKKRVILAVFALQTELGVTIAELHQHILKRTSPDQHRCVDDKELTIARIINEFLGFKASEVPYSQLSQHNQYETFKKNTLARFDAMRVKTLQIEIPKLLAELQKFRANDIQHYRRIVMPRPMLAEQVQDVAENIIVEVRNLSPSMPIVWLDTLDLELWSSIGSPHHLIPGMEEHLLLAKALRSRWDLQGIKRMMLASIGFSVQMKGNVVSYIHIPIRFPDLSVVKLCPTLNFSVLTENAEHVISEHPLRMFLDYLLNANGAVSRILKQGFNMERRANVTRVLSATFDAHTNSMPCKACLEYVAEIQRSGQLLKLIEARLKDLSIHYVKGNMSMTLLFRFSMLSMTILAKVDLLEAEPRSALTPPSSQSPSVRSSKKDPRADKENISTALKRHIKTPVLVENVENNPIPVPEHFAPRFCASSEQNVRTLVKYSAVFHELKVPREAFVEKLPSSVKDYTGIIGSCGL